MTRKSRIKPPPVPIGEDPMVTIGNQEKQIDMLLKRIETLTQDLDFLQRELDHSRENNNSIMAMMDEVSKDLDDKTNINTRLLGWQSCAREVIKSLVEK